MKEKLKSVFLSPRFWQTLAAIVTYLVSAEIQDVNFTIEGLAGYTVGFHVGADRIMDVLRWAGLRKGE